MAWTGEQRAGLDARRRWPRAVEARERRRARARPPRTLAELGVEPAGDASASSPAIHGPSESSTRARPRVASSMRPLGVAVVLEVVRRPEPGHRGGLAVGAVRHVDLRQLRQRAAPGRPRPGPPAPRPVPRHRGSTWCARRTPSSRARQAGASPISPTMVLSAVTAAAETAASTSSGAGIQPSSAASTRRGHRDHPRCSRRGSSRSPPSAAMQLGGGGRVGHGDGLAQGVGEVVLLDGQPRAPPRPGAATTGRRRAREAKAAAQPSWASRGRGVLARARRAASGRTRAPSRASGSAPCPPRVEHA